MKTIKPNFKTAQEWHIYHAFNDPDFKKDVNALGKKIVSEKQYKLIASKYSLPIDEVRLYHAWAISGLVQEWPIPRQRPYAIGFDDKTHKYFIEVDASINKVMFDEIWEHIKEMHKTVTTTINEQGITKDIREPATTAKQKPPQETELLYAVFKAHKEHTFTWIFDKYQDGELPLYRGSDRQFKSPDSLERYYDKYRPDKT